MPEYRLRLSSRVHHSSPPHLVSRRPAPLPPLCFPSAPSFLPTSSGAPEKIPVGKCRKSKLELLWCTDYAHVEHRLTAATVISPSGVVRYPNDRQPIPSRAVSYPSRTEKWWTFCDRFVPRRSISEWEKRWPCADALAYFWLLVLCSQLSSSADMTGEGDCVPYTGYTKNLLNRGAVSKYP